jgi:hypothetical protein
MAAPPIASPAAALSTRTPAPRRCCWQTVLGALLLLLVSSNLVLLNRQQHLEEILEHQHGKAYEKLSANTFLRSVVRGAVKRAGAADASHQTLSPQTLSPKP